MSLERHPQPDSKCLSDEQHKSLQELASSSATTSATDPSISIHKTKGLMKRLGNFSSARDIVLFGSLSSTVLVFTLNFVVTLWILLQHRQFQNIGDLYTSSCRKMKTINLVVHLLINVCSSLVLTSSNFCAQYILAPTRAEVTMAHEKGDWVDIGVSSYRNLLGKRVATRRKLVAICLFLGSLPLHLLWNSVLFSAIPINSYHVALATDDFLSDSQPWNSTYISNGQFWDEEGANHSVADYSSAHLQSMAIESRLEYLDKTSCIRRYTDRDSRHKDVIVVAANVSMSLGLSMVPGNNNTSLLYYFETISKGQAWMYESNWLCSAFAQIWGPTWYAGSEWCSDDFLLPKEDDWTLKILQISANDTSEKELLVKVDHCLSAGIDEDEGGCSVRYSSVLLLSVTCLNGFILACIWLTWHTHQSREKLIRSGQRDEAPLVSIDDAVASFLEHEDNHTLKLPFLEYSDCVQHQALRNPITSTDFSSRGSRLQSPIRWFNAAGRPLWYTAIFWFAGSSVALIVCLYLSIEGLLNYRIPTSFDYLWSMGVGQVHAYALSMTKAWLDLGPQAFYGTMLLTNVPQVVMGCFWYLANSLLTRFLLARRWAQFIVKRKGLRTSSPIGQQRSSYFLSLPYRYSIPLLISTMLIHWLLSGAFFVVQTIGFTYDISKEPHDAFIRADRLDASEVGYSPIAFVFALIIVVGILFSMAVMSIKTLPSRVPEPIDGEVDQNGRSVVRMPLVSTCSAAISAACHPDPRDDSIHLEPVQWGRMKSGRWGITSEMSLLYTID